MYAEWVRSKLPKDIPEDIVSAAVNFHWYHISGLQVWDYSERPPDDLVYTAADEEDLKLWFFRTAARYIAQNLELMNRDREEKNWRYVPDHVENGVWMYRENKTYQYHAIHDTRKYWMEYELRLLCPVFPKDRWMQQVRDYECLMNRWFKIKHWAYNLDNQCFVEISDAKALDWNGVEQPAKGSIISP